MKARDVMTTAVITAAPSAEVREIARMLLERGISAIPIVDASGRLAGMVSEGDLLNRPEAGTRHRASWWLELMAVPEERALEYLRTRGTRAEHVMTREVVTVAEDTPVAEIAALLEKRRIKRVPVVREGKLVGIVSRANLLRGVACAPASETPARSDQAIREALLAALEEAGLPMHHVNAIVAGGVVQLWGWIDAEVQRKAAQAAAEATPGIKRVENHLALPRESVRAAYGGV